ncbi:hypothetical protein [Micromonospora auratinigra]|uniref:Uncharacterized protein n=1 Tax=Micromonospora auratinigra TaxID=261654 RepID=A0A1A9A0Z2_9ACTN|nr:hypothetical protein [Micromonospora auratinigra]SBT49814.1 hypothetical protein GA0070611_4557 [Micromonospora auratinigra]
MTDDRPRKRVESLDDLVTWLQWLADDVARAPDAVVHPELDQFLAACAGQLRDRARLRRRAGGSAPAPSWQLVADVLHDAAFHY